MLSLCVFLVFHIALQHSKPPLPFFRSDQKQYRIHWLEVRIKDIHDLIVSEGRRKFNDPTTTDEAARDSNATIPAAAGAPKKPFHWSWWYTIKVRPFFVKDGGRDVCVCVYHLRWDLFVESLYNYSKRIRKDLKICTCVHPLPKSAIDFRRLHTCQRQGSDRYDNVECVINACLSCKDLRMFKLCECAALSNLDLPPIKAQIWQKMEYTLKDGSIKQKSDFAPCQMKFEAFEKLLVAYWPKFMIHHDVGKWQDDETRYLKTHLACGTTFEIQDFGENYHIERKREHQSFYFCEVGVTLYGCMLRIRVEDLSEDYLGTGEKEKLIDFYRALSKPPIILIGHIIVSEDLSHDNAFVQHVNSRIIPDWLNTVVSPGRQIQRRILCTDGAPNQYKLADQMLWLSKQGAPSSNTPFVRHIFRGTAHGKDDSDPELGHHKNAADRYQLRANDGEVAKMFTPRDFYEFVSAQMRTLGRDYFSRKGVGIYRREFHWVPNHGRESVSRRIAGCNRLGDVGIKKLHFFESIGRPGFIGIRERSCHQCVGACTQGKFNECQHNNRCGCYRVLELSPKTATTRTTSTRRHRENGALAFAEACKPGDFFAADIVLDHTEKFTMFSVAKDNIFRDTDEAIQGHADSSGARFNVKAGEPVIDGVLHSCVSAGGTVFASTGIEMVVPVQSIVAYDLDLQRLEVRRVFRVSTGNREKWQMSSEDHARILKLLSESLDDMVATAVQSVSGRS